jgi:hypothetical protein
VFGYADKDLGCRHQNSCLLRHVCTRMLPSSISLTPVSLLPPFLALLLFAPAWFRQILAVKHHRHKLSVRSTAETIKRRPESLGMMMQDLHHRVVVIAVFHTPLSCRIVLGIYERVHCHGSAVSYLVSRRSSRAEQATLRARRNVVIKRTTTYPYQRFCRAQYLALLFANCCSIKRHLLACKR